MRAISRLSLHKFRQHPQIDLHFLEQSLIKALPVLVPLLDLVLRLDSVQQLDSAQLGSALQLEQLRPVSVELQVVSQLCHSQPVDLGRQPDLVTQDSVLKVKHNLDNKTLIIASREHLIQPLRKLNKIN